MDIYQFPALVLVNPDHQPIAVITCADVNIEISDALHLMLSSGLTILPVTDENRLAGIVLRTDLIQAMMMDAAEISS